MFSDHYKKACEEVAEFSHRQTGPFDSLQPMVASDYAPFLWSAGFGSGNELDQAIARHSADVKSSLYGGRVFVIVPIYVTSICEEQCLYCNYRGGNKGIGVERRRLTDDELEREAAFLVEEKGLRVLELVYSADPQMRVDTMCRHVSLLQRVLERHGGGLVGLSAESLEEDDYRRLVNAGLCWSVLWQETYDKERYTTLHPGRTKKSNFEYRLDAYERMLVAGVQHIGIGVLSGLSDWRWDWAMLMLHEQYLQQQYGRGATILGTPRLTLAPGALLKEPPYEFTQQEYLATVSLHNLFSPTTPPFVSTRENWKVCVELARGGGCLFTLNCSTTPGGYSLPHCGCQFTTHTYDAPIYSHKLRAEGLDPVFDWRGEDLSVNYRHDAARVGNDDMPPVGVKKNW
jgi:thiazole biosynthesis protein ThiH